MDRVLVTNGSYTDIRLIRAFKKMGMYVITSGNAPELLGHAYADEYVNHDFSDKEGMLQIAREKHIDYVAACANDFGVTTAAYIAENMHLPGHDTYLNSRIIAEKDLFKAFAQENRLQVIPSHGFSDIEEAKAFAAKGEYPLIVKPTDLSGGKGVTRVFDYSEACKAIDYAFSRSKAKHIVIEPYITGAQGSITTFLVNEKVRVYSTFREFDSFNDPFLVGYTITPFPNTEQVSKILIGQIEKIASLLHLADGIFHAQFRMHNGQPLIMECMRRCLGNYALKSPSDIYSFPWEEWIARSYCGFDCGNIPTLMTDDRLCGEYYIQAPCNGVVEDIEISEKLSPFIYDSIFQWDKGMEIDDYKTVKLGFLFMKFNNRSEQGFVIDNIQDLIKVKMK